MLPAFVFVALALTPSVQDVGYLDHSVTTFNRVPGAICAYAADSALQFSSAVSKGKSASWEEVKNGFIMDPLGNLLSADDKGYFWTDPRGRRVAINKNAVIRSNGYFLIRRNKRLESLDGRRLALDVVGGCEEVAIDRKGHLVAMAGPKGIAVKKAKWVLISTKPVSSSDLNLSGNSNMLVISRIGSDQVAFYNNNTSSVSYVNFGPEENTNSDRLFFVNDEGTRYAQIGYAGIYVGTTDGKYRKWISNGDETSFLSAVEESAHTILIGLRMGSVYRLRW